MPDLLPYQIEGSRWLAAHDQAMLADDMGLGKSAQAVTGADMVGAQKILVVCPASVRAHWEAEFEKFSLMGRPCSVVYSGKDPINPTGVTVISYDLALAKKKTLVQDWDLIILDEAHYLKERGAQRTKAIYGRGTKLQGFAANAKRVWRLTGTPAPNNASELWSHLKYAGVVTEPYWDFVFRYCTGFEGTYGFQITGHKNAEELKDRMKGFILRRKKADIALQLPPIFFQQMSVDSSHVEFDPVFFEAMQKHGGERGLAQYIANSDATLRAALESVGDSGHHPNEDRLSVLEGMAASMVTLRRYVGMAKLPACLDIIDEELKADPTAKRVIFGIHQCVIEGTRDRFSKDYHAVTLYGKTPPEVRAKNIRRFISDPSCRVFVGNINAAGTGVDGLQKVCCHADFLEQSWVPADNAQAGMRLHRIGQENPVRLRFFSLHRSVDERITQTLDRKIRELMKLDLI